MTEEKFEEFLKDALHDLDPVPPAPRDEMWAGIQRERALQTRTRRTHTWVTWGVGLAAMLAIGVGIGRMTSVQVQNADAPAPRVAVNTTPAPVNRTAYRLAVAEYMSSAEAMLTSFRTQPKGQADPQIAEWAQDLLTNTRLLLDSPAADDPKVAALLEDLELIIAQIARMSAPSIVEREIIRDGMNKTAVLPRLRATQPSPAGT